VKGALKMWVYLKSRDPGELLYTVGFYKPDGSWEAVEDFVTQGEAMMMVSYLNGGAFPTR